MRYGLGILFLLAPTLCMCTQDDHPTPDCSTDQNLCPSSVVSANAVDCSCTCELPHIPLPGAKNTAYKGIISACLPPSLNAATGSDAQKQTLTAMSPGSFNQQVFRYCSDSVADWLSLTIKSQAARFEQLPAGLACQPFKCTCDTVGAQRSDTSCRTECADEPCDKQSCEPILRQGGILDFTSCLCSRTTACGVVSPAPATPALCRVGSSALLVPTSFDGAWHPPLNQE